jgi:hypothetical protein
VKRDFAVRREAIKPTDGIPWALWLLKFEFVISTLARELQTTD